MTARCISCPRTLRDGESCPECGTGGEPPEPSDEDLRVRESIARARAALDAANPRKVKP